MQYKHIMIKKAWNSIMEQGMDCDNSQNRSSKEYKLLYEKLMSYRSNSD